MQKKEYISPWGRVRPIQLQFNAMSAGAVDNVSDQGLPGLESDNTTLGWID